MATAKIMETKKYDIFDLLPFNRNTRNIDALVESMQKYGWLDAYPMHVVRNGGGRLKIVAGHHRFEAAKKAGIPVKYVIIDEDVDVFDLERANNSWTPRDFLTAYTKAGYKDYAELSEYIESTGIALSTSLGLLSGQPQQTKSLIDSFRAGTWKVNRKSDLADRVASVIHVLRKYTPKVAGGAIFVRCMAIVLMVEEINIHRLIDQYRKYGASIMRPALNHSEYYGLIEEVYNYRINRKGKIRLAILAQAVADERNAAKNR